MQGIALVGALLAAALTVALQFDDLRRAAAELSPLGLLISFLAAASALLCAAWCWRAALNDLGPSLPPGPTAQVYFAGQLGKFLPGGVWPVLLQLELGARHGVSRSRSALAGVVHMAVICASGAAIGAVSVLFIPEVDSRHAAYLIPVAVVGAACMTPRVLNRLVAVGSRVARGRLPSVTFSSRGVLRSSTWALATWVFYSVHIGALAADLGASGSRLVPLSLGAYSIAWVAGFLVLVLPSGAGVREAMLILIAGSALSNDAALTLALTSRAIVVVADLVAGGLAVMTVGRAGVRSAVRARQQDQEPERIAVPER